MTVTVLHLVPSLDVGGAETLLLDLVRGMQDAEYRHVVVSMLDEGALLDEFRRAEIPVHGLGMARGRPDLRSLARLRTILRAERPQLLQSWMYHANLLALLAAAGIRPWVREIWCLHAAALDFANYSWLTRAASAAGAWFSRFPAAVVANSAATRTYHARLGYRPRQWVVIPNGIDVRRFAPDPVARVAVRAELGLPADAPLVGLVARWDPMKDHATFLRAAARIAANDPRTHFVIVGHGIAQDNAALGGLIEATGQPLAGRLHLLGIRRDMERLNAAFDVAAITSVSGESFCLAAAEAMASGVACVVTNLTFLPELVGDTGVVVPCGDAEAVARGLRLLLDRTPDERHATALRARQRIVAHFSLDAMIARYRELYDGLLRVPARRPQSTAEASVAGEPTA